MKFSRRAAKEYDEMETISCSNCEKYMPCHDTINRVQGRLCSKGEMSVDAYDMMTRKNWKPKSKTHAYSLWVWWRKVEANLLEDELFEI